MVGVTDLDRADETGPAAGLREDRLHEIGRAGLAVGPGHADQRHLPSGLAEETRRERGEGAAGVRDHRDRQVRPSLLVGRGLHQQRGSARGDRAIEEVVAVRVRAPERHEEIAGGDVTRVVSQAPDRGVGPGSCRRESGHGEPRRQGIE